MKRFSIEIGRPDGKAGETLTIQARTESEARGQALDDALMIRNPGWEILSVVEL